MNFSWDENKRRANLRKHGLDFKDASQVFDGFTFIFEDDRFQYDEQRFVTLGILQNMVTVIIHTESDETIRVISMRKATKHEQEIYLQNRLGAA